MTITAQRRALKETFWIDLTRLDESSDIIKKLPRGRYRVGPVKAQHCFVESTGRGLGKNKNNRRYPAETTWGRHAHPRSSFMEKVKRRRVIGQLEHPSTGRSSMDKGAVIITEVRPPDKDGEVYIVFETMSTPDGKIVSNYIEDRAGFGLSSRGNGSTITVEGVDVVQEDFEPVTWDCVLDESTPGSEVAARRIAESRQALLESCGGDEAKAHVMALQETEEALKRDISEAGEMAGGGVVPTGYNEFILSTPDEAGHYRAYDNDGTWDVYLHIHNLRPTLIASGLRTRQACKDAAETHLARVVGEAVLSEMGIVEKKAKKKRAYSPKAREFISKEVGKLVKRGPSKGPQKGKKYPQKRAVAAAISAARRKRMKVPPPKKKGGKAESYMIRDTGIIDGTTVRLDDFNNSKEADQAASALSKAGFLGVDNANGVVTVHTGYSDTKQAVDHIRRVLDAAGVEIMEESEMARLRVREGVEEIDDENYNADLGIPVYQMTVGQVSLAEMSGTPMDEPALNDPEDIDLDLDPDDVELDEYGDPELLFDYDDMMDEEDEEDDDEEDDEEDDEPEEESYYAEVDDEEADDEDDEEESCPTPGRRIRSGGRGRGMGVGRGRGPIGRVSEYDLDMDSDFYEMEYDLAEATRPPSPSEMIRDGFVEDEGTARKVISLMRRGGSSRQASNILWRINDLVGGFGVEVIRASEDDDDPWDNYHGDIIAEYINTGDTYSATIVLDVESGEMEYTTMGDWVQNAEAAGRRIR